MMQSHLAEWVRYIKNTQRSPLPISWFDDDMEPIGPMARKQLVDADLIEECDGSIMLTQKGELVG